MYVLDFCLTVSSSVCRHIEGSRSTYGSKGHPSPRPPPLSRQAFAGFESLVRTKVDGRHGVALCKDDCQLFLHGTLS